jgi:hypothetical protein
MAVAALGEAARLASYAGLSLEQFKVRAGEVGFEYFDEEEDSDGEPESE